mmetsp:Transcript_44217/g.103894  ORF Transcript_44217/g.103894 Transcript_44217/m.103894 type:complete len:88 (-) Transcript_44217:32-295(-)
MVMDTVEEEVNLTPETSPLQKSRRSYSPPSLNSQEETRSEPTRGPCAPSSSPVSGDAPDTLSHPLPDQTTTTTDDWPAPKPQPSYFV